jgi:ubiquinone/menaquinone biosynthesis C-methylase UbiE
MNDNIMRLLSGLVEPLLAPLEQLPPGAHVLQPACGTGRLSLALARRRPDLKISAIDINPAVLDAGRREAAAGGLAVDFRTMDMNRMEFADGSADAVISRMGLLLPGLTPFETSAREVTRVLRPDGILSLATWSSLDDSPYTRVGLEVLRQFHAPETFAASEAAFARTRTFESHLVEAGLRDVTGRDFRWDTEYPTFDDWWSFVAGFGPLAPFFRAVDEAEARDAMAASLAGFRTAAGGYRLPATARLITARA